MTEISKSQVVLFTCLFVGYAFYILCRKSFTFVIPSIIEDEGWSKENLGTIVSSLNTAYALSKFILGVLSDRISARILFSSGLLISGLAVGAFSRPGPVIQYAIFAFVNGLSQGCGWPAAAKLLRKWFKPSQFGTAWSLLSASANVTGAIVPFLLPTLLLLGNGWRGFMLISSSVSIGAAVIALLLVKDDPEDDKPTQAKVADSKKKSGDSQSTSGWSTLLRTGFLWRLSFYYFVVFLAKTSCENWTQLLVLEEKNLSSGVATAFLSCFEIGGLVSSFTTGYITDLIVSKQKGASATNPRMKMVFWCLLVSSISLVLISTTQMFLPVFAFLLGASLYANINIFGIVATEEAPPSLSGSSHAVVSLAANAGAVIAGYPFSALAAATSWTFIFYSKSALFLVCLVLLAITRSKSTKIAHTD